MVGRAIKAEFRPADRRGPAHAALVISYDGGLPAEAPRVCLERGGHEDRYLTTEGWKPTRTWLSVKEAHATDNGWALLCGPDVTNAVTTDLVLKVHLPEGPPLRVNWKVLPTVEIPGSSASDQPEMGYDKVAEIDQPWEDPRLGHAVSSREPGMRDPRPPAANIDDRLKILEEQFQIEKLLRRKAEEDNSRNLQRVEELTKRVAELQHTKIADDGRYREQVKALEEQIHKLKHDNEHAAGNQSKLIDELEAKITELEKETVRLRGQVKEEQSRSAKGSHTTEKLQVEISRLQGELKQAGEPVPRTNFLKRGIFFGLICVLIALSGLVGAFLGAEHFLLGLDYALWYAPNYAAFTLSAFGVGLIVALLSWLGARRPMSRTLAAVSGLILFLAAYLAPGIMDKGIVHPAPDRDSYPEVLGFSREAHDVFKAASSLVSCLRDNGAENKTEAGRAEICPIGSLRDTSMLYAGGPGEIYVLYFNSDTQFYWQKSVPEEGTVHRGGSYTQNGNQLTLIFDGMSTSGTVEAAGLGYRLSGASGLTYNLVPLGKGNKLDTNQLAGASRSAKLIAGRTIIGRSIKRQGELGPTDGTFNQRDTWKTWATYHAADGTYHIQTANSGYFTNSYEYNLSNACLQVGTTTCKKILVTGPDGYSLAELPFYAWVNAVGRNLFTSEIIYVSK